MEDQRQALSRRNIGDPADRALAVTPFLIAYSHRQAGIKSYW
jgi:hypothetical protein